MRSYQAYPEYKDSGIEWLGEIPNKWKLCPLKYMAKIKNGQDYKTIETREGYPVIGSGGQFTYASKYMYSKESVLLGRKGTIDKPLFINEPFWTVDTMYYTEVDRETPTKYLFYLATTIQFSKYSTSTALPSMTQEHLGNYVFAIPNNKIDKQKTAIFLDHETAKIDTLIEKQQQLIKLLKEKRQAVISHAVTKGLNPDAPMKYSGVEWLGEVPEHWDIVKIKYIAKLTPKKSEVEKDKNKACNFIPMEKLKTDTLILDEIRLIDEVFDGYTYFRDEDILMAKVTPCFENKNIVVARELKNGIGFGSSEIYVLRARLALLNDFLYYRLQEDVFIDIATGEMTGAGGLKRVPSNFLNNFSLALPPENERILIVKYIKQHLLKYDTLVNSSKKAIELMHERRTALISAAVTGKIDVRNWVDPNKENRRVKDDVELSL